MSTLWRKRDSNLLIYNYCTIALPTKLYIDTSMLVTCLFLWSVMAERFSASDLCSDGWVVGMWVRIPAATVVLVSLSKTLYHNCFSPPRSKWVPVRAELVVVFDEPSMRQNGSRELRWFQEWFMRLMSRGNNTLLALWFCLQSRAYLNARYYYHHHLLLRKANCLNV